MKYHSEGHAVSLHSDFLAKFLAHQREIEAFVAALVRNRDLAADIAQETAVVLWERFEQYDRERSFASWAKGIAANKVRQHWDRVKRAPVFLSEEALSHVLRAYDRTEDEAAGLKEALSKCLQNVNESGRKMLRLRYEGSHSLGEVAKNMGRTVAATQKALSRIRLGLQSCIEARVRAEG